jgi:hypothetical protein
MPVKMPGTRWKLMWKRNIAAIAFMKKSNPCFSPLSIANGEIFKSSTQVTRKCEVGEEWMHYR